MTPEKSAFYVLLILLGLSILGLPVTRYGVYLAPFVLILIWGIGGKGNIFLDANIIPFLFLLTVAVATSYNAGIVGLKSLYFVFVYVLTFTLFSFRSSKPSMLALNLLILAAFIVSSVLFAHPKNPEGISSFSLLKSTSSFESTLSFPLSLMAAYWLLKKKYMLSLVNGVLMVLSLKRIAILAFLAVLLLVLLPKPMRKWLTHPTAILVSALAAVLLSVEFASGSFDEVILQVFGTSPDTIVLGRRTGWEQELDRVGYDHASFFFYGIGHGGVFLLHNDLLAIVVQYGWIALMVFAYLLGRQGTVQERVMCLWLLVLLTTDNVLIYQHVMIPFLFVLRDLSNRSAIKKREERE
jgi:hypothetical protein